MARPRPNQVSEEHINRVRDQIQAPRQLLQHIFLHNFQLDDAGDVMQSLHAALRAPPGRTKPKRPKKRAAPRPR
jgi:hypothetical protein